MQPLYSFSASGQPIGPAIFNLTVVINRIMKDRPFKYLDTVVVPEMTALQQVTYSITMVFEAESQKAIDELVLWMNHDEEFQKIAGGNRLQVIK